MEEESPQEGRIIPVQAEPRGGALWAFWAAATAAGWAVTGACAGVLAQESAGVLLYAFVPLSAVGQWLVLRRHFAWASVWLAATIGGTLVAAAAFAILLALPEELLGPPTSGVRYGISTIIDGFALGIAQWLVLRQNVGGMDRWIPATGIPLWMRAFSELQRGFQPPPANEVLDVLEYGDRIAILALDLGVVGLLIGSLTGSVLAWMVDQPRKWEDER